jgi:quercetin dioxygenase-like cupin family protein
MHSQPFAPAVEPGMSFHNPLIKDRVTFLETAVSSGGQRTLILVDLAPGGGNTLHWHQQFNETFSPVEGTLGIQLENEKRLLAPGEKATAPRGKKHRFFNPSDALPVSFMVELRPASEGFERCIAYAYGLAEDGLTTTKAVPKRPKDLALLAHWGDTYMPGPMGVLMRLLRNWGRKLAAKDRHHARLTRYLNAAWAERAAAPQFT